MLALDLCERVKLGLNFLNNCVDKNRSFLPYFSIMFKNDPAEARHDWPDFGDLTGRYVEAFILARKMLKIEEPFETEVALRELLLSYFDEGDGLSYRPKPDKPYYSTIFRREYEGHVAEGFDQARVLWALLAWFEETRDELILTKIKELIIGLDRLLIKKENYGYYDRSTFEPGVKVDTNANPMPHQFYFSGTQIHPLIECYRRLKIDKALELASRLSNYIVNHSKYFSEDGTWNCPRGAGFESAEMDGHTHSRFATIAGITMVGIVTQENNLISKMKRCYDWFILNHCSSFGWSPEFLGRFGDENEGCETCAIMDQLNCCFVFAEAGFVEYYEQAEKVIRNQLFENQIIDTSMIRNTIEKPDTDLSRFHNVANMVKGGFAGWAGPNDFVGNCDHHYCLMNCCGPAGIRAIHDSWNAIYTRHNDDIYIHILMNKNDDIIKIEHFQPTKPVLILKPKQNIRLHINRRTWIDSCKIVVTIDSKLVEVVIDENYITIGSVEQGQIVEIKYEMLVVKENVHVNGRDYRVSWKGDTVTKMDPNGRIIPFYKKAIDE